MSDHTFDPPPELIWAVSSYANSNIPIRPLMSNGDPDVTNLYTDQERNRLTGRLTPAQLATVFDDPVGRKGFHPLKLLNYQIPKEFWSAELIKRQNWQGVSLATGLTSIPAFSDPNKVQLEVAFDIDCNPEKGDNPTPKQIAERLIEELKLRGRTIIQRTPNGGLHVVICIPVDPNDHVTIKMWEERGMREEDCINDCRVAIKIKGGQISLDPTHHRTKTHLKYELLDRNLTIAECPEFYFRYVEELKKQKCIPEETKSYSYKSTPHSDVGRFDLTDEEIENGCGIILGNDNGDYNSIFLEKGTNDTTLAIAGYLYKRNVSQNSTEAFVARLVNLSGDNKLSKRMSSVRTTFKTADRKGPNAVKGSFALIEEFKKNIKNQSRSDQDKKVLAEYRLSQLKDALNLAGKSGLTPEQLEEIADAKLASEKVTNEDIDNVITTITKETPHDIEPVKQIFYGMCTGVTKTPMSHNVNSRDSGAGKTFIVQHVGDIFPEQYVVQKNAMSNKAIFHRKGKLVQKRFDYETGKETFEPIAPEIGALFAQKKELEDKVNEEKRKEKKLQNAVELQRLREDISQINSKMDEINENALRWIDLNNQITLALDTPQEGFYEAMMSIVSQDTVRDQEYEFVEKTASGKIINRINILHGTPCIFSTRTLDETRGLRHEEKTRRLINVTPNTLKEKIKHASNAIISKGCLLPIEYEHQVGISEEGIERCKHTIAVIIAKLKQHGKFLEPKQTGIRAPFELSLKAGMPDSKDHEVWLMTVSGRLTNYLAIITKIHMDNRWRLVDTETGQFWPISTYADLKETFTLMKGGSSNVRIYQANFYNDRFLPLFKALNNKKETFEKSNTTIITEDVCGFTARKLEEAIKITYGETISRKVLEEKLLYPLVNLGILNAVRSQIDARTNLFFPVVEGKIFSLFDDLDDPKFKINDTDKYPSNNLIEESYRFIVNYPRKGRVGNEKKYKLLDPEGKERTPQELVLNGIGEPETCFLKAFEPDIDRKIAAARKQRLIQELEDQLKILKEEVACGDNLQQTHNKVPEQSLVPVEKNDAIQATATEAEIAAPIKTPQQQTLWPIKPPIGKLSKPVTILAVVAAEADHVPVVATIIPEILPFPTFLTEAVPELNNPAWFDFEWDQSGHIYCFCYLDTAGRVIKYHANGYVDHKAFMTAILDIIETCKTLIGFAIFDDDRSDFISDLEKLENNCKEVGLAERHSSIMAGLKTIDLQNIFGNTNIRNFLENGDGVKYAGHWNVKLEDVSTAYIHEDKTPGITGKNVEHKPPSEQLEYCMQDVVLTYKLVQKNNFKLMGIIYKISEDIKLDFFNTCNANYPTSWIAPKFASIELNKPTKELQTFINDNMTYTSKGKKDGLKYVGGYVIPPKMGRYLGPVHLDVVSMYPSMANGYNISPETVNCPHPECKRDQRVPDEVMQIINDYIMDPKNKARKLEPRPWHYWICKRRGKFADLMQYYFQKKTQYKKEGKTLDEKAMKIMANSSYGAFGSHNFEYQDPRVAELITAFGQYTLRRLEEFAGKENVIYGDTDSLYLKKDKPGIIEYARDELHVKLEVAERWNVLFLTNNAKQYAGITESGGVEHTTLTGMKSNYPPIIQEIAQNVISKEFMELNPETLLEKILQYVRSAFKMLTEEDPRNLPISKLFQDDLWDHKTKNEQTQIYKEILEDCNGDQNLAKSQARGGEVYKFWKVKAKDRSVSRHIERYQLDMETYRSYLFNAIKSQLQVYGMNEEELKKLEKELVK